MIRTLPLIAATAAMLSLAGCGGQSSEGPKSETEVKEEVAAMTKMKPGEYESDTKLTSLEIPGMPAAAAQQIKSVMSAKATQKVRHCLTEAESELGGEEMFKKMGQGDCAFDKFVTSASTVDALLSCTLPNGVGTAKFNMTGTIQEESSAMKVNVEMAAAGMPQGKMLMSMEATSKRLGDCAAN